MHMFLFIILSPESDGQTEDGHAMMKFDTFYSFRNLSHVVRGCNKTVNKGAQTSRLTCTCHEKLEEKWQVDCEAKLRGVVGSCRWSGCQEVLSDGSWAGPCCVVSSLMFLLLFLFLCL